MKYIFILIALILLMSFVSVHAQFDSRMNTNEEYVPGTMNGTFSTSASGAAVYSIPLDLPEGRAGMTPKLGLIYNSQQGGSLLGKGWALAGLSSVSRTNPTLYYNGQTDNIDFGGDQLILDGQILIMISQDNYRPENEPSTKVEYLTGSFGNYFKVSLANGVIKEYGNSEDSRQEYSAGRTGQEPLIWHINKVIDRSGNTIKFEYMKNSNLGELYPGKIYYTGYESEGEEIMQGYYCIEFHTATLDNQFWQTLYYQKDDELYRNMSSQLLTGISITYNNDSQWFKYYEFVYEDQNTNVQKAPFLKEIICKSVKDGETYTMKGAEFAWEFYSAGFNAENKGVNDTIKDMIYPPKQKTCKLNLSGTSMEDVAISKLIRKNQEWVPIISVIYQDLTYELQVNASFSNLSAMAEPFAIDIDMNGDDELVFADDEGVKVYDFTRNAQNKWVETQLFIYPQYTGKMRVGDINGDGINDILITTGTNSGHIFFGTANYGHPFVIEAISLPFNDLQNFEALLDINGDGKADILWRNGQAFEYKIYTYVENEQLSEISQFFHSESNVNITPFYEDLNGDGKTDFCFFDKLEDEKYVYFSYGEGFTSVNDAPVNLVPQLVSDLNNDGLADFTEFDWADGKMKVAYGMPDGINMSDVKEILLEFNSPVTGIYDQIMADVDGNGIQDVVVEFTKYVEFLDARISAGNAKMPDDIQMLAGQELHLFKFADTEDGKDVINTFIDGWGAELKVEYHPFNCGYLNSELYSDFPLTKYRGIKRVVSKIYINNADEDFNLTEYDYSMPVMHVGGKGFLGFQKLMVTDHHNGQMRISNQSVFSQDDRYYFLYPDIVEIKSLNAVPPSDLISKTRNAFSVKVFAETSPPVYKPVATESHTQSWDNDGNHTFIRTAANFISVNDFDNYGNLRKTISCADEGMVEFGSLPVDYAFQTITESQYLIDDENWILSRPANYEFIKKYENDQEDSQVTVDYTYYQPGEIIGNGIEPWPKLKEETSTPNGDINFSLVSSYEYDRYGNVLKTNLMAPHSMELPEIEKYFEFDDAYQGRFMTVKNEGTRQLPFVSYYHYDEVTGLPQAEMNPQGLQTSYEYDAFGRLTEITPPDLIKSRTMIAWSEGEEDNPPGAIYMIKSQKIMNLPVYTESEVVKTFYTKYGQDVRTVTRGLNGTTIYMDKSFDIDGRLKKIYDPYFKGGIPQDSTVINYDERGRVIRTDLPVKSIAVDYQGKTTITTDLGTGISVTRQVDALGRDQAVADPSGIISYTYYSSGKIRNINALGSVTEFDYDAAGNQTSLLDPDAGQIHYTYNAYGLLVSQTDANQNKFNLIYDNLNRLEEKRLEEGETVASYYYSEELGTSSYGKPSSIRGNNITYDYFYDNLGRLEIAREEIDGMQREYRYEYENNSGKLSQMTYPSGFKAAYKFDVFSGDLESVSTGEEIQLLWQLHSTNARGQLLDYSLGNGLYTSKVWDEYGFPRCISTTDFSSQNSPSLYSRETDDIPEIIQSLSYIFDPVTGNLLSRSGSGQQVSNSETFNYDNLLNSRLSGWVVNGHQIYAARYEQNGNILTKTGVTNDFNSHSRYLYGNDAGPHAVTDVDSPVPNYLLHSKPQEIAYTAFNKVKEITQNFGQPTRNPGDEIWDLNIVYGPDERRKKTVLSCYGQPVKTKYFTGNFYEEEHNGTTIRKLHYLYASDGLFAIYVMNGENDTMYYVSKDYLGSFDVITDERGNVLERFSFDPWGRRRNPVDWTFTDVPTPHLFDRGYTGHEHLDKFGLINMNGRVYDPWLSRFLSPDPFVQAPKYSQSYNRYSYCLNNPLKYVDPSGYRHKDFDNWEMNYFNSGASVIFNRPDIYTLDVPGSMGYTCVGNNVYIDRATGKTVDYETVFSNYIKPELDKQSGNSESNETVTLYFPRQTPVLTNIYMPGAIQWNIDGTTWYVFGYKTIYTSRTYEVGAADGGGANFANSELVLGIGGGIYGGLKIAVTPGDQWLGTNGKYYSNSWGGNRYTGSRSGALAASNTFKWAGRAVVGAEVIIGGLQVYNGYQADGGQFGYNANLAGASATGSIIGGWAGAEAGATVGAAIGVWFGGVGAVPGAIIGGFIGGIVGSLAGNKVGEVSVNYYYGR